MDRGSEEREQLTQSQGDGSVLTLWREVGLGKGKGGGRERIRRDKAARIPGIYSIIC